MRIDQANDRLSVHPFVQILQKVSIHVQERSEESYRPNRLGSGSVAILRIAKKPKIVTVHPHA